jgi:translation initiation factor IF-2
MEKKQPEQKRQNPMEDARKLEIVMKCDSAGSVEAVAAALSGIVVPGIEISVVRNGVGAVNKSDILVAGTAGGLIVGFQVEVMPDLDKLLRENGVEVRLYEVIYRLAEDMRAIAGSMTPSPEEEQIIGTGVVIALFKSTRKGIIVGCEVKDGFISVGQRFRIVSAMGPVYAGTIESLHIGERTVQKAVRGQQVGIKIRGFNRARIGDIVESFRTAQRKDRWGPKAGIVRIA